MSEDEEYIALYWASRKPSIKIRKELKRRFIPKDDLAGAWSQDGALGAYAAGGLLAPSGGNERTSSPFFRGMVMRYSIWLFLFRVLQGGIIQEKNCLALKR